MAVYALVVVSQHCNGGLSDLSKKICGPEWKITLETCLHYNEYIIKELSKIVDLWIVDIKSMEPIIFEEYTGVKVALSSID